MAKKKKFRYLMVSTSILASICFSNPVSAWNPDPPTPAGEYNIVDVATWDQMGINGTVPPSKTDMGAFQWYDGCMTMSYATFMRKSGQRGKDWGPNDAFDEWNKAGYYGGGQFPVDAYTNGTKWGDWTLESYEQGGAEGLKKAWEDGYALVCHVAMGNGGTHVFSIDSIDGDTIHILDSGRRGTTLDEAGQWGSGSIIGYYKLKSPDGTKGSDLPKLNEVRDGSNSKTSSSSDNKNGNSKESVGLDGRLPSEDELIGMIERNHYLYEYQLPILLPGDEIKGDDSLSNQQIANVASIKEDVISQKFNLLDFLRTLIAFIGISTFVYGFLLLIAYLFDRSNSFIDFSLISFLSFGRYKYSDDKSGAVVDGVKYLTSKGIIKLFFFTQIVGWFLASGTVYSVLQFIIEFISKAINGG